MSGKKIHFLDEEAPRHRLIVFGLRSAGLTVEETIDIPAVRAQIARNSRHLIPIVAALFDFNVQAVVLPLRVDSYTRNVHGVVPTASGAVAVGTTERRLLKFFLTIRASFYRKIYCFFGYGTSPLARMVDVSVCRLRRAFAQLGCGGLIQIVRGHRDRLSARAALLDSEVSARDSQ